MDARTLQQQKRVKIYQKQQQTRKKDGHFR